MTLRTKEGKATVKNSILRAGVVLLSILLQVSWIVGLALRLTNYYAAIQTAASLVALLLVLHICGRPINAAYKLSWVILVLVFPVFGCCLYLLFGDNFSTRLFRKHFESSDEDVKLYLKLKPAVMQELCRTDPLLAGQAHYLESISGYPLYRNTRVIFYGDTREALNAQKQALAQAKNFIFMEYHAIEDSTAWRELEDILAERAAAGVDVRVFYDDIGSIGFVNGEFIRKLQRLGIKCRVFNPLIPFLNAFMNNRDHRKITVVDGCVGFTGGYNLADEYFNLTHPYGQWKDSGLRLEGEAVRSLTVIFLQMWNASQREKLDPTPFLADCGGCNARGGCGDADGFVLPYADTPLDDDCTGENAYLNLIKSASRSVYITTPYLIISDEMLRELTLAAGRGVDVRIVTPGIPDKKMVFFLTRSYYSALAAKGVRIYEYTPGFLHQKQFVADDRVAIVGTINLDFRSLYLHFENACWFCGCDAVHAVTRDFEQLFAISAEVGEKYAARYKKAPRLSRSLLRLFGPLM